MDMKISIIDALDERSGISTPAILTQRPMDGSHWSAPGHVFGESTLVGMSATKSDHDYSHKTNFQIWKENKEFERQNTSMSRPPLELTPIDTNTKNKKDHIWT